MADKKVTELTAATSTTADDLLMIVDDPNGTPASKKITLNHFFGGVSANTVISGTLTTSANNTINGNKMTVTANTTFNGNLRMSSDTPSSNNAGSEGYGVGSIWFDANYIYVATASGTIKRVALSVFS